MKDKIDVEVRRSPKYSAFMGIGAIIGVVISGILVFFVDPTQIPNGYTVAQGAGLTIVLLGVIGLFAGAVVALILDRIGRKRARSYSVEAQIDMVDDPKEIARRRLAAQRGEALPDDEAAPPAQRSQTESNPAEVAAADQVDPTIASATAADPTDPTVTAADPDTASAEESGSAGGPR